MDAVYEVAELLRTRNRLARGFVMTQQAIRDVGIGIQPVFKIPMTSWKVSQNVDEAVLMA